MAPDQTNRLQGTLDMLVLKSLALSELHGLGISAASSESPREHFKSSLARFSGLCIAWKNKGCWSPFEESRKTTGAQIVLADQRGAGNRKRKRSAGPYCPSNDKDARSLLREAS